MLFKASIVLLTIILLADGSVVYAQLEGDGVYRIAVDQTGNMRLLDERNNGSFGNEPKKNEIVITIPSIPLITELINELSENLTAQIEQISLTPGPQGDPGPQGPTGPQGPPGNTPDLQPQIDALEVRIAKLEDNSGNPGDPEPTTAMNFDGNDYLKKAVDDFRVADNSGTIEMWFRTTYTATDQTIFATSTKSDSSHYLQIRVNDTDGLILISTNDGTATDTLSGTNGMADGKWHHLVWFCEGGAAWTLFLDGVLEPLSVLGGSNRGIWFNDIATRNNLTIGMMERTAIINYTRGVIGWTRVYSREMALTEAANNYGRGRHSPASDTTGLVFNLPLSEGTGNPVDDVGSLTMTVTGATWITD
ncbi:LamG domain-containing protein [Chloroflexota bacterium]